MFAKRMHRVVKKLDQLNSETPITSETVPTTITSAPELTAAAALSKMARKKGGEALQLQVEVETEVQWKNLLKREGLIVADVFSSWAGPCVSMVNILKKVKADINDDRLILATACSDHINDLLPFKNQSEPCWLFLGGGKPVKLVRGCVPPKLVATIKSELENEVLCMQGKRRRNLICTSDQVARRKKAEDDAVRLARKLQGEKNENVPTVEIEVEEKEEDGEEIIEDPEAEDEKRRLKLNEDMEEEESNTRLINSMKPYALMAIQCFLLETGAVTEIRDELIDEFQVVQERLVNLTEEGVRRLFNIPKEIPDPTEPEPVEQGGEAEGESNEEEPTLAVEVEEETETMISCQSQLFPPSTPQPPKKGEEESGENDEDGKEKQREVTPEVEKQPEKVIKMIPVDVPEDIIGDTLIVLMDCKEIRKIIDAEEESEIKSTLYTTADDYIQKRVGPESYEEAIEEAPKSLIATYGQGPYQTGVWCPRVYDDKKYAMINFFPRFVTELLTPPAPPEPKYLVLIFPVEMAYDILDNEEFISHKKYMVAQSRTTIPTTLAHQMMKSWKLGPEEYLLKKRAFSSEVFVVSINEKNKILKEILLSFKPIHISVDNYYGKVETAKLYDYLNLLIDEPPDQEKLEKILSKMKRTEVTEDMEVVIDSDLIVEDLISSEINETIELISSETNETIEDHQEDSNEPPVQDDEDEVVVKTVTFNDDSSVVNELQDDLEEDDTKENEPETTKCSDAVDTENNSVVSRTKQEWGFDRGYKLGSLFTGGMQEFLPK